MKKIPLFLISALLLSITSCASKKMATTSAVSGDGSSFDKAIVINETHERQGVDAEYIWIAKTYPGAKNNSQALVMHNNKSYDILHITTARGKAISVYFDISNFFGKL
ncbi:MAG: hypothetical protein ACTHNW_20085 [Mucilaginibacter sp.]